MRWTASGWEGDYEYWEPHWEGQHLPDLRVSDHEAVDTGLVDCSGNTIYRKPNPIGFVW